MAHDKSLKCLTVTVTIALIVSILAFLLSFLIVKPLPVTADSSSPPPSATVGK